MAPSPCMHFGWVIWLHLGASFVLPRKPAKPLKVHCYMICDTFQTIPLFVLTSISSDHVTSCVWVISRLRYCDRLRDRIPATTLFTRYTDRRFENKPLLLLSHCKNHGSIVWGLTACSGIFHIELPHSVSTLFYCCIKPNRHFFSLCLLGIIAPLSSTDRTRSARHAIFVASQWNGARYLCLALMPCLYWLWAADHLHSILWCAAA